MPAEDQGYFIIAVQGPAGASLQNTVGVTTRIEEILKQQPEIERIFNVNGFSFAGAGSNRAILFAGLKPFDERSGDDHSAMAVIARLRGPLMGLKDALAIPFLPPSIQGVGVFGGFQLEIEDRGGASVGELAQATFAVIGAAAHEPTVRGAFATFTVDDPQVRIEIDRSARGARRRSSDRRRAQVSSGRAAATTDLGGRAYRVYVRWIVSSAPSRAGSVAAHCVGSRRDGLPRRSRADVGVCAAVITLQPVPRRRDQRCTAPNISSGEAMLPRMERL